MASEKITVESGMYPPESPFALTIMSGSASQCSMPNMRPVRPQPVTISSEMKRMSWASQISRMRSK